MDAPVAPVATPVAVPNSGTDSSENSAVPRNAEQDETRNTEAPATPAEVRRFKVKVDGEEADVDEAELLKGYQRAQASNKRFEAAAAKEKRLQEMAERAKADPLEFVKEAFGVDVDEIAERRLAQKLRQQLEEQQLSPAERRAKELEAKLAEREAKDKEAEVQAQQAQVRAEAEKYYNEFHTAAVKALEVSGLPQNDINLRRLALYAQQALAKNHPLSWEEMATAVKEDLAGEHTSIFGGLEGESLLSALGPDLVKKVNSALIAKYRGKVATTPQAPKTRSAPVEEPVKRIRSMSEWDKHIADKISKLG